MRFLKFSILILAFFVCNAKLFAQNVVAADRLKTWPKDRIVLEINHTSWYNKPDGVKGKFTSGGVNIYAFFDNPIGKSRMSWAIGFGLSSHNIHGPIDLKYKLDSISDKIIFTDVVHRNQPYVKNRIGEKLLEVPFEMRFRSRGNTTFKLTAGFKVGYVVQSFRKIFDEDGKRKLYDIRGHNPWRYGVTIRVGFEQIHITGFYALSDFFLKGKGTLGLTPYSIGIAYTPRITVGSGTKRPKE